MSDENLLRDSAQPLDPNPATPVAEASDAINGTSDSAMTSDPSPSAGTSSAETATAGTSATESPSVQNGGAPAANAATSSAEAPGSETSGLTATSDVASATESSSAGTSGTQAAPAEAPDSEASGVETTGTGTPAPESSSEAASAGASETESASAETPAPEATGDETPSAEAAPDAAIPEGAVSDSTTGDESALDATRALLEAIVYVTEEPLAAKQIAEAMGQPLELIERLLAELQAEYEKPHRGLTVRVIAGGYKMGTKPEHHDGVRGFVKNLKPPLKLSLAALETLAVIAYKQPITGPEIMEIRGVQGGGVLKTLLDRKLIATAGRKQVIGKPILYKTTKDFLLQFGLNGLNELPTLKEFEELKRMALSDDEPEDDGVADAGEAPDDSTPPEVIDEPIPARGEPAADPSSTGDQPPSGDVNG
jgi:segregation and condensation protein B